MTYENDSRNVDWISIVFQNALVRVNWISPSVRSSLRKTIKTVTESTLQIHPELFCYSKFVFSLKTDQTLSLVLGVTPLSSTWACRSITKIPVGSSIKLPLAHVLRIKELLKRKKTQQLINSFQSRKAQMEKGLQFSVYIFSTVENILHPAPIKFHQTEN